MCLCKTDIIPIFNSHALCKFNVQFNESNICAAFYSSSSNFKIKDRNLERTHHQHWKEKIGLLRWLCAERLRLTFSLICGSLLKRNSSTVMRVALVLSYLAITCCLAYSHLSHVYNFAKCKIDICGFINHMHLHFSSFIWNASQTASWSGLSDRMIRLESVSEDIYTWSFHDQ